MTYNDKVEFLANFYTKLKENGNGFIYTSTQIDYHSGPTLDTTDDCLQYFKVNEKKKKIDLYNACRAKLDCVNTKDKHPTYIYKICHPLIENEPLYMNNTKIKENHWHHWLSGECPLPEGLVISIIYRDGTVINNITEYLSLRWSTNIHFKDVIAFKVIRLADGWEY